MKIYTHIIFDLDRTLFDFERGAKEALEEIYQLHIAPFSDADFNTFFTLYKTINKALWEQYRQGLIPKEILRNKRFAITLEELNIEKPDLAKQMGDMYVRLNPEKAYLFPYAMDILNYLKPKYVLSIMSNGFKETQYSKLKHSGIKDFFKHIFLSDEIGYNKPHPNIFNHALKTMHTKASNCLMVGDDISVDIEGAANMGIDQIYFNPSGKAGKHQFRPTFEIQNLEEIKKFL